MAKLHIKLDQSKLIGAAMLVAHLSAFFIIFWVDIVIWVKLVMIALVLASMVDVFRRVVLRRAGNAITAIELDSDNNMKLIYRSGHQVRVSRLRSAFVNPVVTLFTVAVEDKYFSRSLAIPFDAVDEEEFRQLRVRLKRI